MLADNTLPAGHISDPIGNILLHHPRFFRPLTVKCSSITPISVKQCDDRAADRDVFTRMRCGVMRDAEHKLRIGVTGWDSNIEADNSHLGIVLAEIEIFLTALESDPGHGKGANTVGVGVCIGHPNGFVVSGHIFRVHGSNTTAEIVNPRAESLGNIKHLLTWVTSIMIR